MEHEKSNREHRLRTILGARLVFNDGRSTMDCVVRNISDHGAKIEMPSTVAAPNAFALEIAGKGTSRKAQVRWRSGTAMGVRFVDGPSVP